MKNGSVGVSILVTFLVAALLAGGWFFFLRDQGPSSIEPPTIQELPDRVGRNFLTEGTGEPGAVVSVLVDGKSAGTARVSGDGTWKAMLNVGSEGIHIITAEQRMDSVTSRVGGGVDTWVDVTPPDEALHVQASPPENFNKREFTFTGTGAPSATILVNSEPLGVIDVSGDFSITIPLEELENVLIFTLSDDVGNTTGVVGEFRTFVDSTPPMIRTQYCEDAAPDDIGASEEYVCIRTGSWTPLWRAVRVPISGSVKGKVERLIFNGENIESHNGSVYQEMVLPLLEEVGKYPIVAGDSFGNESVGELILDTRN